MGFPEPFFRWRPHPWHGLSPGENAPSVVLSYIELTPFDYVKYEVDKATGYLLVDRPQSSSSQPPTLYGFVPRTYCGERVGKLNPHASQGDHDPLDICVLTERPINRAEILLHARVIGGLQATDHGEADDKIIAVLDNDQVMKGIRDLKHLPSTLVERLRHYFLTYKMVPGEPSKMTIEAVYDREQAMAVVEASMRDYDEAFGS